MGPVFYLVQCEEARCLISAVVLGNWPHEFALAPSPGKGGCALDRRLCLQRLSPSAEACGAREKSLARNSAPRPFAGKVEKRRGGLRDRRRALGAPAGLRLSPFFLSPQKGTGKGREKGQQAKQQKAEAAGIW